MSTETFLGTVYAIILGSYYKIFLDDARMEYKLEYASKSIELVKDGYTAQIVLTKFHWICFRTAEDAALFALVSDLEVGNA